MFVNFQRTLGARGFAFCPLIPNFLDETIANAQRSLTPQPEVKENPGSNVKGVSSASV